MSGEQLAFNWPSITPPIGWVTRSAEQKREAARRWRLKPGVKERQREHVRQFRLKPGVKERQQAYAKEYTQRPEVKARKAAYIRAYRKTEKWQEWKRRTVEERREQSRKDAQRRRSSVQGTIHNRISRSINASIRDGKSRRLAFQTLGYTVDQLKIHLERQFTKGMTWERFKSGEIHIDHIRPIATFAIQKFGDTESLACWALTNLRPMWAIANMKKGARLEVIL
jgi:hypothetical protein